MSPISDASGLVKYWNVRSSKSVFTLSEKRQTLAAAFSPSKKRLVTTGSTPEIYLYDAETRQRIATLEARSVCDRSRKTGGK